MVDISHTTGDPTVQDASIMDFLRALGTDLGAVGSKIASPFMRGDGTRAVNKGMSTMPTPNTPPDPMSGIGAHPDDFAMSGIGRHPQDNMPNVPAKAPVKKAPLASPGNALSRDVDATGQQEKMNLLASLLGDTYGAPTSAPDPSSIMEGATRSSESTIPPLLMQFWKMMQPTPNSNHKMSSSIAKTSRGQRILNRSKGGITVE